MICGAWNVPYMNTIRTTWVAGIISAFSVVILAQAGGLTMVPFWDITAQHQPKARTLPLAFFDQTVLFFYQTVWYYVR